MDAIRNEVQQCFHMTRMPYAGEKIFFYICMAILEVLHIQQ